MRREADCLRRDRLNVSPSRVTTANRQWRQRSVPQHGELAGIHPVVARVYAARGLLEANHHDYALKHILRPDQLMGLDKAAGRIAAAVQNAEPITIVGDYDADGATATALCVLALKAFGAAHVDYVVPDRVTMGYGLSSALVDTLPDHASLLITVDNGIVSTSGVAAAKQRGCDVVITDHHLPGDTLPEACAIVNPNQHGDMFPSKALCGVGVAFYVLSAVRRALIAADWSGWLADDHQPPRMAQWLDLVALGTVADVVPLDTNNRILVHQGLLRIRAGQARPGLLNLLTLAKRDFTRCTAQDLGFAAGPRLNAAGRLDDMRRGIACLLEPDPMRARAMASELDALNRQRRTLQDQMQFEALALIDQLDTPEDAAAHVLFDDGWHEGVVGLVASKIKERTHRPTIACAPASDAGMLKASGRSIPGFHLRDALAAVDARHPGLIPKFGGHAMAAGLSLPIERLGEFARAFEAEAERQLTDEMRAQVVLTDGELSADEQTLETAQALEAAGPWGQGFEAPLFEGVFDLVNPRTVGSQHVKVGLHSADAQAPLDAIAFFTDYPDFSTARVAYRLEPNEFNGFVRVQAVVDYWEAV